MAWNRHNNVAGSLYDINYLLSRIYRNLESIRISFKFHHMVLLDQQDWYHQWSRNFLPFRNTCGHLSSQWGSIFSFMCIFCTSLLVCSFILFLLAIVLSVLLRFTDSDYLPLVSSNSSYWEFILFKCLFLGFVIMLLSFISIVS